MAYSTKGPKPINEKLRHLKAEAERQLRDA
jgi:hypothetical protein